MVMIEYKVGDHDTRPWGTYEVTAVGNNAKGEEFCEKKITVSPAQILSLQSHKLRREYWEVKSGTLTVVADGQRKTLQAGQSINLALGTIHCMAKLGSVPAVVAERQEGICREEDIIRYVDAYGRGTEGGDTPQIKASVTVYQEILTQIQATQKKNPGHKTA